MAEVQATQEISLPSMNRPGASPCARRDSLQSPRIHWPFGSRRYVIFEGVAHAIRPDLSHAQWQSAGFLLPLTNDLVDFAQGQLPEVVDYDPCLAERTLSIPLQFHRSTDSVTPGLRSFFILSFAGRNPIESILRRFDESSAHVGNVTLKAEASGLLVDS